MTLTLELPDDVATELTRLPDGNTFAVAAIRKALQLQEEEKNGDTTPVVPRRGLMRFAGAGKGLPGALSAGEVQEHINALREEWDNEP